MLRPPGVADFGAPLEEPQYKALGARMAAHNGYANIPGYGLYDTTGGTEDWTFWTAGSLGFTFEIGTIGFHPPYNNGVVDEYLGRGQTAGAGKGGNREAYYEMLASTRDQSLHSVIAGTAPSGSELKISKTVTTETSPVWNNDYGTDIGPVQTFQDTLEYSMKTDGPVVRVERQPVDAAGRGRARRASRDRAAAGGHHVRQPGRPARREHGRPARGRARGVLVRRPRARRRSIRLTGGAGTVISLSDSSWRPCRRRCEKRTAATTGRIAKFVYVRRCTENPACSR